MSRGCQDIDHAGRLPRRRAIEADDAGMRVRRADEYSEELAGQPQIVGEAALSPDQAKVFDPSAALRLAEPVVHSPCLHDACVLSARGPQTIAPRSMRSPRLARRRELSRCRMRGPLTEC